MLKVFRKYHLISMPKDHLLIRNNDGSNIVLIFVLNPRNRIQYTVRQTKFWKQLNVGICFKCGPPADTFCLSYSLFKNKFIWMSLDMSCSQVHHIHFITPYCSHMQPTSFINFIFLSFVWFCWQCFISP